MKDLGMDAYRFSISWSRIFPSKTWFTSNYFSIPNYSLSVLTWWHNIHLLSDGTGESNLDGVQYYNNLINALLEKGGYII